MGQEVRVHTIAIGTRVDTSGFDRGAEKSEGFFKRIVHAAGSLVSGVATAYGFSRAIMFANDQIAKLGMQTPGVLGMLTRLSVFAQAGFEKLAGVIKAPVLKAFDAMRASIVAAGANSTTLLGRLAAMGGQLASLATISVGAIASIAALAVIVSVLSAVISTALIVHSAQVIDQQSKLAARVDASTQALVGLMHASKLAGTEADALEVSVQKLGVNLSKAAAAGEGSKDAFAKLGLSAEQLAKMDRVEAIGLIADRLNKIPNAAERSAIAVELFGKQGAKLGNLLAEGSEGLRKMQEDADRLGLTFTRAQGRDVEAMNDAWTRVGESFTGLGNTLAIALAPASKMVADALASIISAATDIIRPFGVLIELGTKLVGVALWPLSQVLDLLGKALHAVSRGLEGAGNWLMEFLHLSDNSAKANGALTEETQAVGHAVAEYREKLEEQIATLGMSKDAAERYKLAQQGASTTDLEQLKILSDKKAALEAQAEAVKKAKETQEQLTKSVADFTESLHKQVATFGLSSAQAQLWELQRKGATEAQLAEARVWATQLELLEKAKKAKEDAAERDKKLLEDRLQRERDTAQAVADAWKKQADAASKVFEATRTPAEQMQAEIRRIVALFDAGKISQQTFSRALLNTQNQFMKMPEASSFAEKGSQEARARIIRFERGKENDQLTQNTHDMVKEQRIANDALKGIHDSLTVGMIL